MVSSGGGGGYGGGYGGGSEMSEEERELTKAQKDLLELQTSILKEQQATMKALMPFIAEQSGYELEMDASGKIIGAKPSSSPDAVKRRELESGLLDRSLKALRGELPISPALEQALTKQEQGLKDRLAQQFGPGYETSSPGIETLGEFNKNAEAIREDARMGALGQSEQLQQARGAEGLGRLGNVTNATIGAPLNIAQLFGGVQQGYAQAQQPYTQSRLAAMQANTQQSIAAGNQQASMMGAILPFLMGGFSDERMKTDIKKSGLTLGEIMGMDGEGSDIDVSEWRYKTDPKGTRRYGPMAQDIEEKWPDAVGEDARGRKFIRGDSLRMNLMLEKMKTEKVKKPQADLLRTRTLGDVFSGGA